MSLIACGADIYYLHNTDEDGIENYAKGTVIAVHWDDGKDVYYTLKVGNAEKNTVRDRILTVDEFLSRPSKISSSCSSSSSHTSSSSSSSPYSGRSSGCAIA